MSKANATINITYSGKYCSEKCKAKWYLNDGNTGEGEYCVLTGKQLKYDNDSLIIRTNDCQKRYK